MTDYSLGDLVRDMNAAAIDAAPDVQKVIVKAAVNIKKDWRANASGLVHAPAYPYSITYDVHPGSAVIGPDKQKRQGALGNLIEYGSINNAPHNHGKAALDAETPRMARALLTVLVARLKGR